MPILVAPTVIVEPPPVAPPPPTPPPPREAPTVAFTDPAGRVTQLTDWEHGWVLQPGAKGLDMPAYTFSTDESPGIDGSAVRQVRAQSKEIILPVAFWMNDSRAAYLERRRTLIRDLNPKRGAGTLTVTQPNGDARSISCFYQSGLEGDESADAAGMRWAINALTFMCPSPYWIGESVTASWAAGATGDFFPVLPLTVGDGEVLGSVQVDNPGDDDAFPVWTITGTATAIELVNETSGQSLLLTHTLSSSDTVVIDTRERQQTALLNGVTNLWPDLSDDSTLWALDPGTSDLTLTVSGSDVDTRVWLDYQPRYLAA